MPEPPKPETIRFRAEAGTNDIVERGMSIMNRIAPGICRSPSDYWRLAGTFLSYGLGVWQPDQTANQAPRELSIDTSDDVD